MSSFGGSIRAKIERSKKKVATVDAQGNPIPLHQQKVPWYYDKSKRPAWKERMQIMSARHASKMSAGSRRPVDVREEAFGGRLKKKRGRAQTVLSRARSRRPGLLNLLSGTGGGGLLGLKSRLGE